MSALSNRVQQIKPSATLTATAKAAELRAQGKEIITLSAGEPDFNTPIHICQAAMDAIRDGKTRYTAVDGTPELKQAIRHKLKSDNQLDYQAEQILVSCGAKHSIFNALMALVNPGDEVLIPAPYWVSYPDMTRVCDGKAVIIKTNIDQHYKINAEQLKSAITPKSKILIINSPSNPSGMLYSKAELTAIADVIKQHPQIVVISDDIYEHIQWTGNTFNNIVNACPELKERTLVINGVSKAYAMTGWRIGYAAGPAEIIKAMKKLQSQNTSNPCSISQAAAAAALDGDQECLKPMVQAFHERHDYVHATLSAIKGVKCVAGQGAFYSFPDVSAIIQRLNGVNDDVEFATFLLEKAGIAVVPGSAFGMPGAIRLSYATSMQQLEQALAQFKAAIK